MSANCVNGMARVIYIFPTLHTCIDIFQAPHLEGLWSGYQKASTVQRTHWDTGVNADVLKYVGARSVAVPDDIVCIINFTMLNLLGYISRFF